MAELQILGADRSNFVWMVRMACTEKGVPYTLVPATPHTPEVDVIHPFGKIPAMRHGDVTLCESRAICSYIDAVFPGPKLLPDEPVAAARIEQWVSIINTHIDPLLLRRYLLGYVFPGTPDGSPNRAIIDEALPKMPQHFDVLDREVAATGYLAGDDFTIADMNLLPILFYMSRAPESSEMLAQRPNLCAYFQRHLERPSVKATMPQNLPEKR